MKRLLEMAWKFARNHEFNPKLFDAADYDWMFIRGEDGRVRYVHTSKVCANCVRKIMASNR